MHTLPSTHTARKLESHLYNSHPIQILVYTPLILYSFIYKLYEYIKSYTYLYVHILNTLLLYCILLYIQLHTAILYVHILYTPILYIHTYNDKTQACTLFRVHTLLATRVTPGRLHYVTVPMNRSALYHISHFRIRHVKR